MVWGDLIMTDITPFHLVQGRVTGHYYRDNILTPCPPCGSTFCFSGRHCPCSPCMNRQCSPPAAQHLLNEHVWNVIERRICECQMPPTTLAELGQALQQEWNRFAQMAIGRIIRSMPRRLNKCLTNRAGITQCPLLIYKTTTNKKNNKKQQKNNNSHSNLKSDPIRPPKIFTGHTTYCNMIYRLQCLPN